MRTLLICLFAFWGGTSIAQNKQLLYGMDEVPQHLLLNPGGKVSQKVHIGIPLLSQLHVNAGASGIAAYDIFQENAGDINDRIRTAIFDMEAEDFFTATEQLHLLDFGWRARNEIYFSGGVYQELDIISYFPRDLAILAWEGNRDYIGYPFDLGELNVSGEMMTVYHFGANKALTDALTVGVRAKLYSSMIQFSSTDNQGTFVTEVSEDGDNIYRHRLIDADVSLQTAGFASLQELDGANAVTSELLGRSLFGGNIGVGFDIGATYDIGRNWTVSGSILDAGVTFYGKDVETYQVNGSYDLSGIELIFPPLGEGEETIPYYSNLEDDIEERVGLDTITNGYTRLRPLKVNAAVEYRFGLPVGSGAACDCKNLNGAIDTNQAIGGQLYTIFRPKGPQLAATAFYYRKLWQFLSAKATYTIDPYSFSNIGLGVVADIGSFNMYLAADNLLWYNNLAKAKSVSLQLGLNIKIGEDD
ncbi:DUF5723 family protein [Luteirhabdus pelagi]|uniref:DUF5723 family protein n=1 Tax=Luteirhabdus pelagi TaxID=2792783 RepID=UPI001939FCC3|nr:DUF5723 family protein [Luteirhabdus pelagi]